MFNQVELMEIQDYIIAEEEVNTSDDRDRSEAPNPNKNDEVAFDDETEYLKGFITEGVERFLSLDTEDKDPINNMIIKNIRKKKPLFKITDEEEIKTIREGIKKRNKEYLDQVKSKALN